MTAAGYAKALPPSLSDTANPSPDATATLSREALKAAFLASLPTRTADHRSLKDALLGLQRLGIPRCALVRWAVEAGHSESYARSFLSEVFRSLGLCARKGGAGRKADLKPSRCCYSCVSSTDTHGRGGFFAPRCVPTSTSTLRTRCPIHHPRPPVSWRRRQWRYCGTPITNLIRRLSNRETRTSL
jgi:hypothetical protein